MEPYTDDKTKRGRDPSHEHLLSYDPNIDGVAIVSTEGLPIKSELPQGVDETKNAAISASLVSLSKHYIAEMRMGELEHVCLKASDGYIMKVQANPKVIVSISSKKLVRMTQIREYIRKMLKDIWE